MSEIKARPVPIARPKVPLVRPAPRLGLASIQAVAFEGDGKTDAAWAIVFESPEGDYTTLATGLTLAGKKRTQSEVTGEAYGHSIKQLALLDAFEELLRQRDSLNVHTLSVHCPDPDVADGLTASLGHQSSTLVGTKGRFSSEYGWGKAWEAWPRAYDAAAALALEETLKNPLKGASDGSLHPKTKGAGAGWVLADGRCGAALVDTTQILAAELRGALDLMSSVDKHQAIDIEIDSRDALNLIKKILKVGAVEATMDLSGLVNTIGRKIEEVAKDRHINLTWVRGHSGKVLNEAADDLALTACRLNRNLASKEDLTRTLGRVQEDVI